jgi:aryl-alcohol dehydrogenase-like predicted oxidoreductase
MSEERIGRFLSHRRKEFILSTKVGETFENGQSTYDYTAAAIRDSIHRSLQRLRTEVLDLVFIHSRGDDEAILSQSDLVPTLQSLREAGWIRFLGISGKTPAGARLAMDWACALMVEYHLEDTSHDAVMSEARNRGIGVVVKKGLASGKLSPAAAIPFVLKNPAVASLIVGGLNLEHLKDNQRIAGGGVE